MRSGSFGGFSGMLSSPRVVLRNLRDVIRPPVEPVDAFIENTEISPDRIMPHIRTAREYYDQIDSAIQSDLGEDYFERYHGGAGQMTMDEASLLYALVRVIEPDVIIETGVAQGASSTMVLNALNDNDSNGILHSIDLPKYAEGTEFAYKDDDFPREGFDSAVIPEGKECGWLVEDHLRGYWELHTGRSDEILIPLLENVSFLDLFIHDSEHTYQNMMWEMSVVWPYLDVGDWMWVDDHDWNAAFRDFTSGLNETSFTAGRAGLIEKGK